MALGPPSISLPNDDTSRTQVVGKLSKIAGIEEFRGLPYGTVPGRWRHSLLRTSLPAQDFDASRNGSRCPQPQGPNNSDNWQSHLDFPSDVTESEFDCLNLFVTRPDAAGRARAGRDRLPVFVWIHGGGFGFGASTDPMWDPARLVARSVAIGKPIIAVMINYRLGIFGFGASPDILAAQSDDDQLRGCNFGLGDQRTALEWIARNIEHFGGDLDQITLGGQSAGGSSVHAHVLEARVEPGKPLFQRATIHSGAVGNLGPVPLEMAGRTFSKLYDSSGISSSNSVNRIAALNQLSQEELLHRAESLGWMIYPLVEDGLTIKSVNPGRFDCSFRRYKAPPTSPSFDKPISILIGDTDAEATIWHDGITSLTRHEQIFTLFTQHLGRSAAVEGLSLYDINPFTPLPALHAHLTQLLTDSRFGLPTDDAARDFASLVSTPEHPIRPAPFRRYRVRCGNPWPGPQRGVAQHCVELIYLFDGFHAALRAADEEGDGPGHGELVDGLQGVWIEFIAGERPDSGREESALVVERDRSLREVDVRAASEWVLRRRRFDWIRKHHEGVDAACFDVIDRRVPI